MHHAISFILRIAYACFFGFILLWHTNEIVQYIPQLLGTLLMLESISQLLELFILKIRTTVSWSYFIIPVVILLFGLWLFFYCHLPLDNLDRINTIDAMAKLRIQMKAVGFCFILFIISEVLISIVFFEPMYMPKKFAERRPSRRKPNAHWPPSRLVRHSSPLSANARSLPSKPVRLQNKRITTLTTQRLTPRFNHAHKTTKLESSYRVVRVFFLSSFLFITN